MKTPTAKAAPGNVLSVQGLTADTAHLIHVISLATASAVPVPSRLPGFLSYHPALHRAALSASGPAGVRTGRPASAARCRPVSSGRGATASGTGSAALGLGPNPQQWRRPESTSEYTPGGMHMWCWAASLVHQATPVA